MSLDEYHAQMAAIRARFAARVGPAVADLRARLARIEAGTQEPHDIRDLHRGLHDLSGTAPSVGFAEIGEEARRLELMVAAAATAGMALTADSLRALSDGLRRLQTCADAAQADGGADNHRA